MYFYNIIIMVGVQKIFIFSIILLFYYISIIIPPLLFYILWNRPETLVHFFFVSLRRLKLAVIPKE